MMLRSGMAERIAFDGEVLSRPVAALGCEIKPAAVGTAGCELQSLRFLFLYHHQRLTGCP